jgi:hypothetical protein
MYSQNIEHIYNTDKILVQKFSPWYVDHEKQYTNPVYTHIACTFDQLHVL